MRLQHIKSCKSCKLRGGAFADPPGFSTAYHGCSVTPIAAASLRYSTDSTHSHQAIYRNVNDLQSSITWKNLSCTVCHHKRLQKLFVALSLDQIVQPFFPKHASQLWVPVNLSLVVLLLMGTNRCISGTNQREMWLWKCFYLLLSYELQEPVNSLAA